MRTTREIMVPQIVTTYKCDTCDFSTEQNRGCCGMAPIMTCTFCQADACSSCRVHYNETGGDYDDALACAKCRDKADQSWTIALTVAARYESISDVVQKIFNNFEQFSHFLDDLKPARRSPDDIASTF